MPDVDYSSTNRSVQGYRQYLEQNGTKDPRSDIELTVELGDMLRGAGNRDVEASDPDFRSQYLAAKQSTDRGILGEVGSGFGRGLRGLASTAIGATALASKALGLDDTAATLAGKAKDVESGGEDNAPTVESMGDVQDVGGAVRYGLGKIGEAAPSIGEAILTGIIGSAAGTAVEPGGGTIAGGVGGFIAKQSIKNLIKKGVAGLAESATEAEVRAALKAGTNEALKKAFKAEAGDIAKRVGAGAVTGLNSYALSAGELYNDTGDVGLSAGAGALAALPDTVLPNMVLSRFFKGAVTKEGAEHAGTFFKRLLKDAAKEAPIEAGTEAFQELVGIAADKYKNGEPATLNDADIRRLTEAAVGGAAGGLVAAPISAYGGGHEPTASTKPPLTPEQQLAARQAVASGQPLAPVAPVAPVAISPQETLRNLRRLPNDQQDARIGVLQNLATRSKAEENELGVLNALVAQRPPAEARTAPAAPIPPGVTDSADPVIAAEAPAAVPPAAGVTTPVVTGDQSHWGAGFADEVQKRTASGDTPGFIAESMNVPLPQVEAVLGTTTPVVASPIATLDPAGTDAPAVAPVAAQSPVEAPPPKPASTKVKDIQSRTRDVGSRLSKLITSVPSLDVSEARTQLTAMAESTITAEGLTKLEATLTNLESKSVAEAARAAAARVELTSETAKKRADLQTAKDKKAADRVAEQLQKLADNAAKKITPETIVEAPVVAPAVATQETLAGNLAAAIAPVAATETPTAAPVVGRPFSFGKVTLDSKPLAQGELPSLVGAKGASSSRSLSRVAVALEAPDGRVVLRGASNFDVGRGMKKIGTGDNFERGVVVQEMGRLQGKDKSGKVIVPGGNQQVLYGDLIAAGYKPVAQINFSGEPGKISETYANRADFQAAWDATEKVGTKDTAVKEAATTAAIAAGDTTAVTGKEDKLAARMSKLAAQLEDVSLPQSARQAIESQMGRLKSQIDTVVKNVSQSSKNISLDDTTETVLPVAAEVQESAGESEIDPNSSEGKIQAFLVSNPEVARDISQRMIARRGDLTSKAAALTNSFLNRTVAQPLGIELPVVQKFLTDAFSGTRFSQGWDAIVGGDERVGASDINRLANLSTAAATAGNFQQLLSRLQSEGHNISVVEKAMLTGPYANAQGWYTPGPNGSPVNSHIFIAMDDVANGGVYNIAALIHEMAHKLMDTLTPAQSEAVLRAADNTIKLVRDGKTLLANSNANASAEEKIVSTLGIKLTEEGFGQQAPSMAQAVFRAVKELYFRTANAFLESIGAKPGDAFVLSWFENSLRRTIGGDFDYRFADLLSPFRESRTVRAERFSPASVGAPVVDFADPVTRTLEQPQVVPMTVEAADWNIAHTTEFSMASKEESTMSYVESMSRVTAAAWNELVPILEKLKTNLGAKFTDAQFWSKFARGDLPSKILARMEERAAGSSAAHIGDANFTDAMTQRAKLNAYQITQGIANVAKRISANKIAIANERTEQLVTEAKRMNRIEHQYRDASAVNAHFNDTLRDSVKELARDIDRGVSTSFAAGKLMGAIREAEHLTEDQSIPESYTRVFKTILDGDGTTSLFDKLEAISKLDLPLTRMTVSDVMTAISENAPKDPALASLVANRPLLVALSSLVRNSTREMDLLQLRTLKNTTQSLAIKASLDEIRTATDERLTQLSKDFTTGQANATLAERLRSEFVKARRDFRTSQRVIENAENTAELNRQVAIALQTKATELSRDVGAFSSWEPHNGANYLAMQQSDDGKWTSVTRTLRMVGTDIGEQREQIRRDLIRNRLWIEDHQDEAGSRLYEEVKRQTDKLGVAGIGEQEYRAAHRFLLDRVLQPLGQKFSTMGKAAGKQIQQMLNRWQFITRTHADEVEALSRKWNKSFEEAQKAAGYKYSREFMQEIYDPVIYAIESDPGADEAGALRTAVRTARARLREGTVEADNFAEKIGNLMRATKLASEKLANIAEKQGVYIADKRIVDPLTGKDSLQRHAVKYGWATVSRKLRSSVISTLVHDMQTTGWREGMFADLAESSMGDQQFQELVNQNFTPNIRRTFVEPFVHKPGKEVFFGAEKPNGDHAFVSQVTAQEAYEEAGGSVLGFIDNLFHRTNEAEDASGLSKYRKEMLQRFASLYEMESKLAAQVSQVKDVSNPDGPKSHRIMDGRTNDIIPPEHFTYDVFDPSSSRIGLAEIAYHAAFGRDGVGADRAVLDLKTDLQDDARLYDSLTGPAREKRRQAIERGLDFKKIQRASEDIRSVDPLMRQFNAYFGGGNPTGGLGGTAKTALELLQLNTQLVLNQPKSGLWNILSIADFPVVFRGLGKSSLAATALSAKSLAHNVLGTLLESVNINVLHASEYAKEIGDHFEGRETERLPLGVMMSDIGKGGEFESQTVTPLIRKVNQLMKKGVKFGKGDEFGGNNALWAPFNFINTQVASSIATGNVQTFELMVKKAAAFYEENPHLANDPSYRLTAEDLGMGGKFGFFSDTGAYDYYRRALADYQLGSLEDVTRDAMGRMAKGERILTKQQVLSIATMSNNEISLESSVNSRPVAMFNNPVLRLGGLLMGWPLAKMDQVHRSLKTSEGQVGAMSVLKGIGVLAAWSLPIGLAYSMLMDRYDEDILKKKSNLRAINPIAGVPIVGPLAALLSAGSYSEAKSQMMGMMERSAKAGNVWGLGSDFINSMTATVDPTSGQRDFDLNSRVLAYSQYANMRDTVRNLIAQDGAVTYSSIVRPLLSSLGGNGLLQYEQIMNNALGLSNSESAVTNRTNVYSWLRAAGREAGIEIKGSSATSSPTPTSVWVREMQLAAMANDRLKFLDAYRSAIEAARADGESDPESKILESYKARDPQKTIFASAKLTTDQQDALNQALGEKGRAIVNSAEDLYHNYLGMIAPSPLAQRMRREQKADVRSGLPPDPMAIRRQMASAMAGY